MNTVTYLKQIDRLNRMIQNKLSEIDQLQQMAISITIAPKEVNVKASSDKDKMGNAVAKIVDLESEVNSLVNEYIAKRKQIIQQIDSIKDVNMYHVLAERYIVGKSLNVISVEMNYSYKQIKRIYNSALLEFEKLYGSEYL